MTNIDAIATDTQEVDSYLQHGVSVGYHLNLWSSPTSITLGIENVADEWPPFVEGNTSNGFDSGTFSARGRYYYLRATVDIM